MLACLAFAGLSVGVRYSHKATWLVSPLLNGMCFYYFSFVEYDPDTITNVYTSVIAINCSYFIAVVFNETWLISTAMYLPMLGFFMKKLGRDYVSPTGDDNESIIRLFFCCAIYAGTCYISERANKRSFVGTMSEELLFKRWLKVFETFPEGLAFVRNGQILYANDSIADLLRLETKLSDENASYYDLKKQMKRTQMTRTGGKDQYKTTAWSFLKNTEDKGGPFRLSAKKVDDEDVQAQEKYVSVNKVNVDLAGKEGDKLLVVRDLGSYISLKADNFTKQVYSSFVQRLAAKIKEQTEKAINYLKTSSDSKAQNAVKMLN